MSGRVYQPRSGASEFYVGEWRLCVHTNSLQRGDTRVELENRLVMLLLFFIDHQGEVLDKECIIKTIWQGKVVNDDSLAVAISHLRKALGDNSRAPAFIKTIPGVGYQLIASAKPLSTDTVEALHSILAPLPAVKKIEWSGLIISVVLLVVVAIVWLSRDQVRQLAADPVAQQSSSPLDEPARTAYHRAQTQIAAWDPVQYRQAIQTLRDILLQHPDFAPAYTSMAEAKIKLLQEQLAIDENCAEVLGLLDKAIGLDQRQASAWLLRGNSVFWCKRDYPKAEHCYQQAMQLNPADDQAPMQYAQLLLAQGRFAESLQHVDRARQLNPLNYSVPTVVWIYQMQKRDDLALQELQRIAATEPDNRYTHISAQRVYERLGRARESFDHLLWLMRAADYSGDDIQQAQDAFARGGLPGVNRWLLARKDAVDLGQYTPPLSWARYALAAGELEEAMNYIEQAFAARQSPLLWASVDPAYDPLRTNARFQSLVAQWQHTGTLATPNP